ncbi:acyltransferase family protein [Horticoccus sp. 23ND18S-11]|uniref:acyltransferase family protein n=1 Tax=Horticoccus sp. 23ND18S-11 TaxID=3391832 RepID=UPI0039C8D2BB
MNTSARNDSTTAAAAVPAPHPAPESGAVTRLTSLDAYRGFVMFLMMAEVLRISRVARALPESGVWKFLSWHQSHVDWIGCSLHDLIQPSFSFLVGVALPFSVASRIARGQSNGAMLGHALWRAIVLILLGVFLRSTHAASTNWTFEDTLTQIGLGYAFLFALGLRPLRDQWIALGVILVGYWALFALHPVPGADFDYAKVGVTKTWLDTNGLNGFAAHWQKNSNAAWSFDTWFMNLFSREKPFLANRGGYVTLSFIPTLGTMILGLIAGGVLRSGRSPQAKLRWLVIAGVIGLGVGALLGALGVVPVVKRIWTPSWVLFSGGWCCLLLAFFYGVVDHLKARSWAFPLVVIGVNSIAAYLIAHLFQDFILTALTTHLGLAPFQALGPAYQPFLHGAAALGIMWLLLFWMYRRKLFLRI